MNATGRQPTTGADVPAAITALYSLTPHEALAVLDTELAFSLGVLPITVARWRRGVYQPSAEHFDKLRGFVDAWYARLLSQDYIRDARTARELAALKTAARALTTDAERAELDRLAADIAANLPALQALNGV